MTLGFGLVSGWRRDFASRVLGSARTAAVVVTAVSLASASAAGQDGQGQPEEVEDSAQEAAQEAPGGLSEAEAQAAARAKEVFEAHIAAMGGREAVFGKTRREITGTYTGSPLQFPGRLRMVLEAPNKLFWEVREPAGLALTTVYNGEVGWRETQSGVGDPQYQWVWGAPLEDLIESASFYGEADYENRYQSIRYVGQTDFYGTRCHVVRGVRQLGKLHLLMFDTETALYAGARTAVLDPNGNVRPLDVRITEWQLIDGVQVPIKMVQQFRGESETNVFNMARVRHVESMVIDWSPPAELGDAPELDDNFLPIADETEADAASEP